MAITSLDGYVADEKGSYDWAMPDDEVFGFVNDFDGPVGTYLYGPPATSLWAAPPSPPRRSRRAWSTSAT